jgi:hypothetical protein
MLNDPFSLLHVKHCFAYAQGHGKPDAIVFVIPGVDPKFVLDNDIPKWAKPRPIKPATAIRICMERSSGVKND